MYSQELIIDLQGFLKDRKFTFYRKGKDPVERLLTFFELAELSREIERADMCNYKFKHIQIGKDITYRPMMDAVCRIEVIRSYIDDTTISGIIEFKGSVVSA